MPEGTSTREDLWRAMLAGTDSPIRRRRRLRSRLPSSPRCKMCAAPFSGLGGAFMSLLGHRPWPKNPKYCTLCFETLRRNHGGAELECSLLFADVRGSTPLAETMPAAAFSRLMGRFYDRASEVLV